MTQANSSPQCPVCAASHGNVLHTFEVEQAARHFLVPEAAPERYAKLVSEIRRLWGGQAAKIVACSECGFTFADPYVGGSPEFYDQAYAKGHSYPQLRWEFVRSADDLSRRLAPISKSDRRILEIGAGDGAFCRMVVPSLVESKNFHATEYAEDSIQRLSGLGVNLHQSSIVDLPHELDGSFDAVCMFQVLEHTDNLSGVIQRLGELCRENARLYISVPNERWTAFNESNGGLMDMPPNHIGRWTPSAFAKWGESAGWKVVDHDREPVEFKTHFTTFVNYRYRRMAQSPGSIPHRIDCLKGPKRKVMRAAYGALVALGSISRYARMAQAGIGTSQMVILERGSMT